MLYDLFSLDISVALCRDNRSGYHYRLDGQSSARQDDAIPNQIATFVLVGDVQNPVGHPIANIAINGPTV